MSESDPPSRAELGPPLSTRVVALRDAFEQLGIPYAFGGAIALFYHREPRSTLDIDVNIFLPPAQEAEVVDVLATLYAVDAERVRNDVQATGQTRSIWDTIYIDLFFADTDFHQMMARRVDRQPFLGTEINVLSIEDLVVCKMLFDRPKDWLDIEAVGLTKGRELDRNYMETALAMFVDTDDARFERLRQALEAS
jgi:hypothetical protein